MAVRLASIYIRKFEVKGFEIFALGVMVNYLSNLNYKKQRGESAAVREMETKEIKKNGHSIDLSKYDSRFSLKNKLARLLWNISYWVLFRPFTLNVFKDWRAMVLRLFGAKIGRGANIYSSVKIWAPWNLQVGDNSSMGPGVDCYNQGEIIIGDHSIVSQKTYLCASSHDFRISNFPLILKPIRINDQVWIAADAFIGPGVFIGEGAVVGARAAVFGKVEPWTVVGGNPSRFIKFRKMIK